MGSEAMITPEMIEAAGEADYDFDPCCNLGEPIPWSELSEHVRVRHRKRAQAALTAALSLASLPIDKGKIGELIERTQSRADLHGGGPDAHLLRANAAALRSLVLEVERLKAEQSDWWCEDCKQRYCGGADEGCSRASCPKCGKWMTSFWERRIAQLEAALVAANNRIDELDADCEAWKQSAEKAEAALPDHAILMDGGHPLPERPLPSPPPSEKKE